MIIKGFQINLDSEDEEEETSKVGLAGNEGIYGANIIAFAKREVSYHVEEDEEED